MPIDTVSLWVAGSDTLEVHAAFGENNDVRIGALEATLTVAWYFMGQGRCRRMLKSPLETTSHYTE